MWLPQGPLYGENIDAADGQRLHVAMFGGGWDGHTSLPSGNKWTFAETDRNRTM